MVPEPGLGRCGGSAVHPLGHLPQNQFRYFLCFLAESLGKVYVKGELSGCAQAPRAGGKSSCISHRPRSDVSPAAGGWSLIHPLSSCCLQCAQGAWCSAPFSEGSAGILHEWICCPAGCYLFGEMGTPWWKCPLGYTKACFGTCT